MSTTMQRTFILAIGLMTGLTSAAVAQDSSAPKEMDALFACQSKTDDAARLSCFDETVGILQSASRSGDLIAMTKDEVENVERDAFGFNLPSLPKLRGLFESGQPKEKQDAAASVSVETSENDKTESKSLDRVMLAVDRYETFNGGRLRFYLTNGQVWYQTDSSRLNRPRPGQSGVLEVEIRKAAFDSFLLQVNGTGRSIRVRRSQ